MDFFVHGVLVDEDLSKKISKNVEDVLKVGDKAVEEKAVVDSDVSNRAFCWRNRNG